MNTRPQSTADAARRVRPKAPASAKKLTNGAHKAKSNGLAAHGKPAAAKSPASKSSAVRTKTSSAVARKAPTSSAVRKRRSSPPPPNNAQDNEMKETIAFRLSSDENNLLDRRKKEDGIEVSLTLRSLLITHLLIGHDRIVSATFIGGYKATYNDKSDTWSIADKDGEVLHKSLDRDEALIRVRVDRPGRRRHRLDDQGVQDQGVPPLARRAHRAHQVQGDQRHDVLRGAAALPDNPARQEGGAPAGGRLQARLPHLSGRRRQRMVHREGRDAHRLQADTWRCHARCRQAVAGRRRHRLRGVKATATLGWRLTSQR